MSIATQRVTSLRLFCSISALVILGIWPGLGFAQTTAFTYSGKLTDNGNPANGNFDLQFALFDNAQGGAQIGVNQTVPGTAVNAGVFTVQLDFGVNAFPGANRFLEIGVRPANVGGFTVLGPRQQISSTPYAIRTLSAGAADALSPSCVGCVQDSNIAAVGGGKLTGAIAATGISPPAVAPAGQGRIYFDSASNKLKASEDGSAYVNLIGGASGVNGSGTVNRIPFWSTGTTLADSVISQSGTRIGIGTTAPTAQLTVVGGGGLNNVRITDNNTLATALDLGNTSTGGHPWRLQSVGSGVASRVGNFEIWEASTALNPAIAIQPNGNIGIGTTSPSNTLDVNGFFRAFNTAGGNVVSETNGGTNAWAKFWVKTPAQQWSIGSSNNFNGNQLYFSNETAGGIQMAIMPNGNVGIGTVGPTVKLHVAGSGVLESSVQSTNERAILSLDSTISGQNRVWTMENGFFGTPGLFAIYDRTSDLVALAVDDVSVGGPYVGIGKLPTTAGNYQLDVNGNLHTGGFIKASSVISFGALLNGDTSTQLCRASNGVIASCSSSLRYKENVTPFNSGLDVINRLQPITFDWKTTGVRDIGLGAEDVANVEPLLVFHNQQGEIEGVKYGQLATLFINAFKEQQKEIESLRARVQQLEDNVRKE